MRTHVNYHKDTCKLSKGHMINCFFVPDPQISHTSYLYGGLKPIRTLGSVMTCADHSVRDLFDTITVYGDMPLPDELDVL